MSNTELVNNKIVNIELLKKVLNEHFIVNCKVTDLEIAETTDFARQAVHEFIQKKVEHIACDQQHVDYLDFDVYEQIENVNELRDTQNDFVDEYVEFLTNKIQQAENDQ